MLYFYKYSYTASDPHVSLYFLHWTYAQIYHCCIIFVLKYFSGRGFFYGSTLKESTCDSGDIGDVGLIPGSGRCPGEGNGNSLQYPCLENSMDRRAWKVPWGCKESDMTEQVSTHTRFSCKDAEIKLQELGCSLTPLV